MCNAEIKKINIHQWNVQFLRLFHPIYKYTNFNINIRINYQQQPYLKVYTIPRIRNPNKIRIHIALRPHVLPKLIHKRQYVKANRNIYIYARKHSRSIPFTNYPRESAGLIHISRNDFSNLALPLSFTPHESISFPVHPSPRKSQNKDSLIVSSDSAGH